MIPSISLFVLSVSWAYGVYAYGGVEVGSWRWCVVGVCAAALIQWLFPQRRREGESRKLDAIILALVLFLGVLQLLPVPLSLLHLLSPHRVRQLAIASQAVGPIQTGSLSSVPAATRDSVLTLAVYVVGFLLVCDLRRRMSDRHWILAVPVVMIAFLEAVLGLFQYYGGGDGAVGTYVNRNHFAGLLEMGLPLALMLGIFALSQNRDRFQSQVLPTVVACVLFGSAAVMLVSVINSQSRMGFISVLVSLFICGVVGLSSHYSAGASRWPRWLPVAAVTVMIGLGFVFLPSDQLIGRFATIATTQEPSEDTRKELWKETIPLIEAYPIAGCGLGAYESCFLPYKNVAPGYTTDFAHNDYLQLAAEFGLPGFVLVLTLAVLVYGSALRRTNVDNPGRYLAIACVGSLSAILLHSLVDFNLYIPANGMLAVWIGALARES